MATKRKPLLECLECGKKFYIIKAAEKASYGARGCPGCGGVDIDVYVEKKTRALIDEAVDALAKRLASQISLKC